MDKPYKPDFVSSFCGHLWSYTERARSIAAAIGSDRTVYVGRDSFYAFDANTGNVKWIVVGSDLQPFSSPAIGSLLLLAMAELPEGET